MKLIIRLGNPGTAREYDPVNIGFLAMDHFLYLRRRKENEPAAEPGPVNWDFCELFFPPPNPEHGTQKSEKVVFLKPQTEREHVGTTIKQLVDYYEIDPSKDLLLIHDDPQMVFGKCK